MGSSPYACNHPHWRHRHGLALRRRIVPCSDCRRGVLQGEPHPAQCFEQTASKRSRMTPKRFMLIAGEASGDILAAELVGELRAAMARVSTYSVNVQPLRADLAPTFFGAGGPAMANAG